MALKAGLGGTPRSRRGCVREGFTLIEVMIALVLVLALTTLAWASLSPLRNRVAREEATAMVADGVERARSMAASSQQVLEVRASIEARGMEIQVRGIAPGDAQDRRGGEGEERPWRVLVRIEGAFGREDSMGEPVALAEGEPEFVSLGVVLPDGSMVPGVPLRMKDSDGRWAMVRVGTWTTRIEVEAEPGGEDDSDGVEGNDSQMGAASADGEGEDGVK